MGKLVLSALFAMSLVGAAAVAWVGPASAQALLLDDKAATCGKPGLPDCPLQSWMKANIVAPKAAGDMAKLEANVRKIADLAPEAGWKADWKKLSDDGAAAAKAGDKDALNKACNTCHDKYRKLYREKYRDKAVPK